MFELRKWLSELIDSIDFIIMACKDHGFIDCFITMLL